MPSKNIPYKIYLAEEEMPRAWYNVKAHMKTQHPPFLNPATQKPCTMSELGAVFCEECVEQELNEKDERIDYAELERIAVEAKPKMIVAGASTSAVMNSATTSTVCDPVLVPARPWLAEEPRFAVKPRPAATL